VFWLWFDVLCEVMCYWICYVWVWNEIWVVEIYFVLSLLCYIVVFDEMVLDTTLKMGCGVTGWFSDIFAQVSQFSLNRKLVVLKLDFCNIPIFSHI